MAHFEDGVWYGLDELRADSIRYYRPSHIIVTSTKSSVTSDSLQADNCKHCHAAYGHKIICPLLNHNVAEANSATLTEADAIRIKALGVIW